MADSPYTSGWGRESFDRLPWAMKKTATETPKFLRPPVVELALGIQFEPLGSLSAVQVAAWRERLKSEFPIIQDQPALPDVIEEPDLASTKVVIQIMGGMQPQRFWFINTAETELIQIQWNRFVYNWRKRKDGDQYPSYDVLQEKFKNRLKDFVKFIQDEKLGGFAPGLCEVTYINQIGRDGVWKSHGEAAKVFSLLSGQQTNGFLPLAESVGFSSTYRIPVDAPNKIGRLRVQAEPSYFVTDKSPLFRMSVSARVPAATGDVAGVLKALDLGHLWATHSFDALTTGQMHQVWEKPQ